MQIQHRRELVELLRHFDLPLTAVCVGVAEGNFDRDLLTEGLDKLYSVDNWGTIAGQKGDGGYAGSWHNANYESAMQKLKPFGEKSLVLKGMSAEMAKYIPDNSVGLVYLDAGHDYKNVMQDLYAYFPKLVSGGIMAGHDFLNPSYGVKEAVFDFCEKKYEVNVIPELKQEDAGFWFCKL